MAKKTPPPRPNQNADGQAKQAAANPTGGPAAAPDPQPGQAPSLVPPGGPPPIGAFAPSTQPMGLRSDARTQTNFKDLPPLGQMQAEEQMGLNPSAPLQMVQQQLQSSMQQPDTGGPIAPNAIGPNMPPGIENFPSDMAALMQTMQRGYAPGATAGEHAMAQNAHSIARATEAHAQNQAAAATHQQGVQQIIGSLMQALALHGSVTPGQPAMPGQAPPTGGTQLQSSY